MKRLVLVLLMGVFSYTLQAQAKIEFKETTIDYGEIEKGSDGLRVFEFTNTGDEPLIIAKVKLKLWMHGSFVD